MKTFDYSHTTQVKHRVDGEVQTFDSRVIDFTGYSTEDRKWAFLAVGKLAGEVEPWQIESPEVARGLALVLLHWAEDKQDGSD